MNIFKRIFLVILITLISAAQTGSGKIIYQKALHSQGSNIQSADSRIARNHLKYKSTSTTVWGIGGTHIPTVNVYKHLAFQGVDNTLVVMLNIKYDTDPNPGMFPDNIVKQALSNANKANVKTTMLKLHLGMDYCDSYTRSAYHPNEKIFFENWKSICLHYAQMCNDNNIPILCIGCEQSQQTVDANYSYWEGIVSTIRNQYPNLLLTYAANSSEYKVDTPLKFWGVLDFIGFNMYFHYTDKLVSENPTLDELIQSYYAPIFNGKSMIDLINMHANAFNKKIFITETGLMPKDIGLSKAYDESSINEPTTYDGISLAIRAVCVGLCQNSNIVGFSWWHASTPFNYFNDNEVTSAEQTMHDYVKGGLI
ncbi:hypothetical protein LF65_01158 [Clostridium beijerinckii]|uniref:Glycoside hydrolase family 5 domain-containing protein n=1 Tax=Clostridium beijerinckii TaxID=1520 RepID=A0A0B5QLX0_CLOBE|nr:hypothetical protein [Clostridium beijerinckii]AJG97773.1 hypothetical protein LF65_01158 [Clostridium beijerinckii]